jgi:hypothetical protein
MATTVPNIPTTLSLQKMMQLANAELSKQAVKGQVTQQEQVDYSAKPGTPHTM